MSHIVTIKTKIRDPDALSAACRRLGLEAPVHGTATLFSSHATGLIVKFPDWHYPIVIDTASSEVLFRLVHTAPSAVEACRDPTTPVHRLTRCRPLY